VSEAWQPAIVFMDMRLPKMRGSECVRRIKALGDQAPTIIVVTASAIEEDRVEATAAGADGYILKPFREEELFGLIESAARVPLLRAGSSPLDNSPARVRSEAVAALPKETLRALAEAARLGDVAAMMMLCEHIGETDPVLSAALGRLATGYEHEQLLKLCEASAT
jgi:CheY-like chemotaxis protein